MIETTREARHGSTIIESVRRRWLLAGTVALLAFAVLMWVVLQMKPLYTSQTTLILPFTPVAELTTRNDGNSSPQSDPYIIHSYVQIMKDDGICLGVIRQLKLLERPEFDPPPSAFAQALGEIKALLFGSGGDGADPRVAKQDRVLQLYKKRLTIFNDGRSLAVDVMFQAQDASLAAAIADAHASAYLAGQVQYRLREAQTKTMWMDAQLQQSAKDLRAAHVALQLHQLAGGFGSANSAADDSADFKFRQAILNSKQSVYESLLNRQQIMLAEQRYDGFDTRILSAARPATHPSFPNKLLFGAVALMVALMIGAGAAWAAEGLRGRRRSAAGHLADLGLEALATIEIPSASAYTWSRRLQKLRLKVFWEKMREVRSAFGPWQNKGLVLSVTSAAPQQATSLFASSLARAIAASGVRTLLLDLDLRHPKAHTFFGLEAEEGYGVQECLKGDLTLKAAVRPVTGVEALFLLSSSSEHRGDVDFLAGSSIKATLAKLRREYKAIIIDTPPIGVVCDSLVIADLADQVVLVCDEETLGGSALVQAVASLRRRAATLRGAIVTTRRPAGVAACRAIERYSLRDKLSEVLPVPPEARRRRPFAPRQAIGVGRAADRGIAGASS